MSTLSEQTNETLNAAQALRQKIHNALCKSLQDPEVLTFISNRFFNNLEVELRKATSKAQQTVDDGLNKLQRRTAGQLKKARSPRRGNGRAGLARVFQEIEQGVVDRASQRNKRVECVLFQQALNETDIWKKLILLAVGVDTILHRYANAPIPLNEDKNLQYNLALAYSYVRNAVVYQGDDSPVPNLTVDKLTIDIWKTLCKYFTACRNASTSWRLYKPPTMFKLSLPGTDEPPAPPTEEDVAVSVAAEANVNEAKTNLRDSIANRFF